METTRQHGEGRLFTFLASGWHAEVVFHAGIAESLRREGNRVHVVVVGARYRDAYEQTGCFDAVYDLTTWSLDQPACQGAPKEGWLDAIEERLGIPSLWQLLSADRYLCRHSFAKNLDAVRFQDHFWETYFQEHAPALLFGEVSHFHNWLASLWAKKEGVPYIQPITSRIPKRTSFGDGAYAQRDAVGATYRQYRREGTPPELVEEATAQIKRVEEATARAAHLPPSGSPVGIPFGSGSVKGLLRGFRDRQSPGFKNDYTHIPAAEKVGTLVKRMARKWAMTLVSPFEKSAALDHPFVLFGLHMQPEASTLVRGQFHQDMAAVAENLARSLPGAFQLVVKDHDIMFGHRPRSFYQRLRAVPNIRLISPYESGPELLRKAAGVAVISGSMGWDSVQLGIPTLVVGEAFYRDYDGLEYQPDPSEWPAAFARLLKGWSDEEADRVAMVAAVLTHALPVDMDKMRHLRDGMTYPDADNMARALMERAGS